MTRVTEKMIFASMTQGIERAQRGVLRLRAETFHEGQFAIVFAGLFADFTCRDNLS